MLPFLLCSCAAQPGPVPPFAAVPWETFSRENVVAIAEREWRLFGSRVDDAAPGIAEVGEKPERMAGLWQRVGEYWWAGQNVGTPEARWTGKHDGTGAVFNASADGDYAWSAAFVSYVMRIAGAGVAFPYSPNHSTYINLAAAGTNPLLRAYAPDAYAPLPGDLICHGRGVAAGLRFADLPTAGSFPAHCDIVVEKSSRLLSVIGGNVNDTVTLRHIPITFLGTLGGPHNSIVDPNTNWMVVLRINYATPTSVGG